MGRTSGNNSSPNYVNNKPRRKTTLKHNNADGGKVELPDISVLADKVDGYLRNILAEKLPVGKVVITHELFDDVLETLKGAIMSAYKQAINEAIAPVISQIDKQHQQLDAIDQNSRALNLCIHGVPEYFGENTVQIVQQFAMEKFSVDLPPRDIVRAKRVGPILSPLSHKPQEEDPKRSAMEDAQTQQALRDQTKDKGDNGVGKQASTKIRPKHRVIVVSFSQHAIKTSIFAEKRRLKNTGMMLSEDLTPARRDIYKKALGHFGLKNVWSQDGLIKILIGDKIIKTVTSMKQLEKLIGLDDGAEAAEGVIFSTPIAPR